MRDFYVAHDALEWLPLEWELDSFLQHLVSRIEDGTYRATPPETIRAAKAIGLTRPIAFLRLEDAILYRTIVSLAENSLLANSKPWTRMGRADDEDEPNAPVSGWFRAWLRRRGQIWTITESYQYLVETDIANFFPYVQLPSVLDHMLEHSNLGGDVVRLLGHMLSQFCYLPAYRQSPIVGLPQEVFNSSRIIAHTYLQPLDEEFRAEGEANRFTRYVDDMAVGANTLQEAYDQISRIQKTLEPLGLYPNTAKTRILQRPELTVEYFKEQNDYLGLVDKQLDAGAPVDRPKFVEELQAHLTLSRRGREWSRVLRRYYTCCRRLHDETLLHYSFDHLVEVPDSARSVFDYLSTFEITAARHQQLVDALGALGNVYEDVRLLAFEYVCGSPNQDRPQLREQIAGWALCDAEACYRSRRRVAAAAAMTVGKFGTTDHLQRLHRLFAKCPPDDGIVKSQLLVIGLGAQLISPASLASIAAGFAGDSAAHIAFLRAVIDGDRRALNMTMQQLSPATRRDPDRFTIRPRMLFLGPLVKTADPVRWNSEVVRWLAKLESGAKEYFDAAAARWLTGEQGTVKAPARSP